MAIGKVRLARYDDLDTLEVIYTRARQFMHTHGNPFQWNDGHPNRNDLMQNLEEKELYVVESDTEILGSFVLHFGTDPTYEKIDGAWLNEEPYAAIHKVASTQTQRGVGSLILSYCKTRCQNLKIDTHADNLPMQKCIQKNGFLYTGTIFLQNGDPRHAYQFSDENK